jgi:hypothetical protein
VSPRLESRMIPEDYRIRLIHLRDRFKIPFMGEMLPTIDDMKLKIYQSEKQRSQANRRAREEAKRAEEEAKRANALEAEVARLRALLEKKGNTNA